MADVEDLRLELRQAAVSLLRATAAVVAVVPELQIFGETVPAEHDWPFISTGFMRLEPQGGDFYKAAWNVFDIHTFAKGPSSDALAPIDKAVIAALDDAELILESGFCADVGFVRANVLRDTSETGAYHGVLNFRALTGVPT